MFKNAIMALFIGTIDFFYDLGQTLKVYFYDTNAYPKNCYIYTYIYTMSTKKSG